jgi:DNA-binding CsgD family transcriptional regulator
VQAGSLGGRRREQQHLAGDAVDDQVAERLSVGVHTVGNHIVNLSAKVGTHSKLEVLAIAVRKGLVSS